MYIEEKTKLQKLETPLLFMDYCNCLGVFSLLKVKFYNMNFLHNTPLLNFLFTQSLKPNLFSNPDATPPHWRILAAQLKSARAGIQFCRQRTQPEMIYHFL